ncbi:unnamed protein product [Ascophyllum nodosum]
MAAKGTSAGRKSLDRAMSMAEAAPVLAPTPHSQLGASFQENEGGRSGGPSSSSRKPGSRSGRSKPRPGGVHAHVAAYEGDLAKLRRYVEAGGELEKRDSYRATPLLLAAEKGHEDCVTFLLDSGADITATDEHDYTALHLAAFYGRVGVVALLLSRGADTTAVDDRGRVPKRLSSRKEISNLLAAKETESKLRVDVIAAVERNDLTGVKNFITGKGDLNLRGKNDMTPLHVATFNQRVEIVKLLLDGGADPNSTDEDKDTPLHYACSSGNEEIIRLLLSKGADPTASDGLGRTPSERNTTAEVQKQLQEESYKSIPKNIAQIRRQTEALQQRVDTNESIFVQKAIAIKGLRIAIEAKDAEIRNLKRKVLQQDADLKALKTKMTAIEEFIKQTAEACRGDNKALEQALKGLIERNTSRDGQCQVS